MPLIVSTKIQHSVAATHSIGQANCMAKKTHSSAQNYTLPLVEVTAEPHEKRTYVILLTDGLRDWETPSQPIIK